MSPSKSSPKEQGQPSRAAEQGATLIEAVLFTVIALGLIAGGIAFFEQASTSAKTNDAVRMIASVQSQVRALFQSQPEFGTADITALLISSNAVPSAMVQDTDGDGAYDSIVNAFGGEVLVEGATAQFTIELTEIPVDVCSRILPFDALGNGQIGSGIASVSDGTDTDSDGLTSPQAAVFCNTNASDGRVDIEWTFDRG